MASEHISHTFTSLVQFPLHDKRWKPKGLLRAGPSSTEIDCPTFPALFSETSSTVSAGLDRSIEKVNDVKKPQRKYTKRQRGVLEDCANIKTGTLHTMSNHCKDDAEQSLKRIKVGNETSKLRWCRVEGIPGVMMVTPSARRHSMDHENGITKDVHRVNIKDDIPLGMLIMKKRPCSTSAKTDKTDMNQDKENSVPETVPIGADVAKTSWRVPGKPPNYLAHRKPGSLLSQLLS